MKRKKKKSYKIKIVNKTKLITSLLILIIIILSIILFTKGIITKDKSVKANAENKIDKCIVIDAGHGGTEEPGCIFGNIYEKNINLQIAKKLQTLLEKDYANVVMTRTNDKNVYLNERVRIANRENADLFVSIHQNALENDTVTNGIETWFNPNKDTKSKRFAECIQKNVIGETKGTDLGIKESTGLIVIKNTNMPSCLIETGFLSNKTERNNLVSDIYQQKIADGIYNGIKEYLNENSKKNQEENNLNNNI